ncbi:unnamed protein product [Somion occarium]|uniref:Uncharacterized protein n=1 Tax=Somion occarium TaxID=3059160 RepID=A0ABP1E3D0_9APHY
MRDELPNRRQLHRRKVPGLKRLQARFSPTAIWTTLLPTETAEQPQPTVPAATPSPPAPPVTSSPAAATPPASVPAATPSPATRVTDTPSLRSSALPVTTPLTSPAVATSISNSSNSPTTPVNTPTVVKSTPAATPISSPTSSRPSSAKSTVSRTVSNVNGAASASVSATSEPETASSGNTGAVVGGVIAGLVALALIVFTVTYFVRRARRKGEEDAATFNADTFRRQSAVLPDGNLPARSMTMNRGYNNDIPPPSMFEQRPDYAPASYPASPISAQTYNGETYGYQQPSFNPGQFVNMAQSPHTPLSVTTPPAHPFFSPIGQSPMNSPTVAPYDSAYNAQGEIVRQNSVGASAYLTRQSTMGQNNGELYPHEAHYVDLNRSSVTPFQAQQYEEISRRLNTTPPMPVVTPVVASAVGNEYAEGGGNTAPQPNTRPLDLGQNITTDSPHLAVYHENAIPESPFADPHVQQKSPEPAFPAPVYTHGDDDVRAIRESFPVPPSPAFSSKSRIPSTPPILPEIQLQQRSFSPISHEFPMALSSGRPSPSPLAPSFNMPIPPVEAHFPSGSTAVEPTKANVEISKEAAVVPQARPAKEDLSKRPDTVYTLYDDDDAYAGI